MVLSAHYYLRPSVILGQTDDDLSSRLPIVRYAGLALVWGIAVSDLVSPPGNTTGAICPAGTFIERFALLAQVVVLLLDAVIIYFIGRLRQSNQDQPSLIWRHLGCAFWVSAVIIAFVCWWSYFDPTNAQLNLLLSRLEGRDVAIDSMVAALTLASGVALLGTFHADLAAVAAAAIAVLFFAVSKLLGGILAAVFSVLGPIGASILTIIGFATLFYISASNPVTSTTLHRDLSVSRSRYYILACAAFIVILFRVFFSHARDGSILSPKRVMMTGQHESDTWLAMASKSTSLKTAVDEYRSHYGIPPPPNFDKWYEFATSVNSPIIDVFDQINSDLLPFWGMPPADLRKNTTHLLEHPILFMGGLLIKDGKTSISPHVRGTHRWMMDAVEEMVKPFSQFLPDMHLAFNLDDECRVFVPINTMERLKEEAQAARSRAEANQHLAPFSKTLNPAWSTGFLDADESIWNPWPATFQGWSKKPIFNQLISSTCPVDSPARNKEWWNRKVRCDACAAPHMEDGFVSNWTLSGDLCHQPDLAHLHGFLQSPSALSASRGDALFPVFSQARVHNFADILYPSPWNFIDKARYEEDKDALPFRQKRNDVYWRGTSSDGFAIRGSWQTFLRARFVYLFSKARESTLGGRDIIRYITGRRALSPSTSDANNAETSQRDLIPNEPLTTNVSFVDNFSRCEERECVSEKVTFYGSATAEPPPSLDFQECWQHRHLVDLDGAGFSGRFLPFVQSSSLPYRAALFRTWWEERIHPWKHYIPLDLRLNDFWPAVRYFGNSGEGVKDGEVIAQAGQHWARKALRKEDMQVYMFRLLLEWGRLVDDEREKLGFSLDST